MITISHYSTGYGVNSKHRLSNREIDYLGGELPPNYPVPAIKLFVLSDGDGVTIVPTTKVSALSGNWLINTLEGCTYYP